MTSAERIRTLMLCFGAALFEGLDIQSMGVAAPRLAESLSLGPAVLGWAMSASLVGLAVGALAGGWLSDRIGRAKVLAMAMAWLGICSLLTAYSKDGETLVLARLLVGLGLGGAFPTLIALAVEAAPRRWHATAVGIVYGGLPLGGAVAGLVMAVTPPINWHAVFTVGGIGPLAMALLIAVGLPKHRFDPAPVSQDINCAVSSSAELCAWRSTFLLWTTFFFTLFAVYVQINWMPSLLRAKGMTPAEAGWATMLMNLAAVVGSLALGPLSDRVRPYFLHLLVYLSMIAATIMLTFASGTAVWGAVTFSGAAIIGGQLLLYVLAPQLYHKTVRGRGIGAAVAIGRLGAIVGPATVGVMMAWGIRPAIIPLLSLPGLIVALICVSKLRVPGALTAQQKLDTDRYINRHSERSAE